MKSTIATVALLSSVANALTFSTPTDVHSASPVTITWTPSDGDPSNWSLFLVNTAFHNTFAIANPVNNSAGTLTVTLPAVPVEDGYTLEATQIGNISQVVASSGSFSIAAPLSSSSSVASSTAASSASGSAAVSGSGTSAAATSLPSGSSAAISGSSGAPSPSGSTVLTSGSASGSATGSSSDASASPTNFNGAASVSSSMSSWVAAVFAMAAGAIAF
ncbi:hypothetical protein BC629DRAFT_1492291 [Irpex lacteus]|nr:hypothetical protein BC629DRAFT_1492291 [Irpex lacteus]